MTDKPWWEDVSIDDQSVTGPSQSPSLGTPPPYPSAQTGWPTELSPTPPATSPQWAPPPPPNASFPPPPAATYYPPPGASAIIPNQYVSFGTRLAARLLDGVLLTALSIPVAAASFGIGWAINKSVGATVALYITLLAGGLAASAYYLVGAVRGQTVGKKAMGYHNTQVDGRPVGYWRSLLRELLNLISTIPLMLGWLAPLWSKRRQTWHDSMSGVVAVPGPSERGSRPALVWFLVLSLLAIGGGAAGAATFGSSSSFDESYDTYDPYDPSDSYDPYDPSDSYDPYDSTPSTVDPFDNSDEGVGTDGTYPLMPGTTEGVDVRSSPSLSAPIVGHIDFGSRVTIVCTAYGDGVSRSGRAPNDLWNQVESPSGYVPDAYILTGTNEPVADAC